MFKKQPKRKLIIVPKRPKQRKIGWKHIIKVLKTVAKRLWGILGALALIGLWLLSLHMIEGAKDIQGFIWAGIFTLMLVAYIWIQIARRRRPPKDWQ